MSERSVPMAVVGWVDGDSAKVHGSKRSAYYAIAKRLVLEKYPPNFENDDHPPGWTQELHDARAEKAMRLFYRHGCFDQRRWRAFLTRVARFLAFVDKRRGPAWREVFSPAFVQRAYELSERGSTTLAVQAAELREASR